MSLVGIFPRPYRDDQVSLRVSPAEMAAMGHFDELRTSWVLLLIWLVNVDPRLPERFSKRGLV